MSKTRLEQIFNEQFEGLEPNPAIPGPEVFRPRSNMSTEDIFMEMLACFKNEGIETFEEVWESLGVPDGQEYAIIWAP